ncbi:13572_t:CDS:2, partial [Funneliformis geosporum]
ADCRGLEVYELLKEKVFSCVVINKEVLSSGASITIMDALTNFVGGVQEIL